MPLVLSPTKTIVKGRSVITPTGSKKIKQSLKNKTCPYESHYFPFQNGPF